MALTTDQQHELLLKNDASVGYAPDGYDYREAYLKVAPLKSQIEREFGGQCFEQDPAHIHDMCVYSELFVPPHVSTRTEFQPCISLCTFGEMVGVSQEAALTPGTLDRLKEIFDQFDLHYISEEYAKSFYDGKCPGMNSWWARYFEWL